MLSDSIFLAMNQRSQEVKTDYLGLGVFPMKIVEYKEELTKAQKAQIKMILDTGFKYQDGKPQTLNVYFGIEGTYRDNKENKDKQIIDLFVKFQKECLDNDVFTAETIGKTVGKKIAVAMKRDNQGYLGYWYAGHIKNLTILQASYKPKDDSNGVRPEKKDKPNEGAVPLSAPEREPIGFDSNGQPIWG